MTEKLAERHYKVSIGDQSYVRNRRDLFHSKERLSPAMGIDDAEFQDLSVKTPSADVPMQGVQTRSGQLVRMLKRFEDFEMIWTLSCFFVFSLIIMLFTAVAFGE